MIDNLHQASPHPYRTLQSAPLPARPKTRKIELEAAFSTPTGAAVLSKDGEPDWDWFKAENGLNGAFIQRVAPRLADFDTTRLQAMDETGIDDCVSGIVDPGIQAMKDPGQAKDGASQTNDYLAQQISKRPDRFMGFASLSQRWALTE